MLIQDTQNITLLSPSLSVASLDVTFEDPVLTIAGRAPKVTDDGKDVGIQFHWHDGTTPKLGFFGFDRSAQNFVFISDATNSNDVMSGTAVTIGGGGGGGGTGVWPTARTLTLTGDVTGSATFDGSADISLDATVVGGTANLSPALLSIQDISLYSNAGAYLVVKPSEDGYQLASPELGGGRFVLQSDWAYTPDQPIGFYNLNYLSSTDWVGTDMGGTTDRFIIPAEFEMVEVGYKITLIGTAATGTTYYKAYVRVYGGASVEFRVAEATYTNVGGAEDTIEIAGSVTLRAAPNLEFQCHVLVTPDDSFSVAMGSEFWIRPIKAGSGFVTGPAGADGNTILSGSSAPSSALGTDGDFYIDTTANSIYGPKTAGAWGSGTSLGGGGSGSSANDANTLVLRDGNGSFAAGTISLDGNLGLGTTSFDDFAETFVFADGTTDTTISQTANVRLKSVLQDNGATNYMAQLLIDGDISPPTSADANTFGIFGGIGIHQQFVKTGTNPVAVAAGLFVEQRNITDNANIGMLAGMYVEDLWGGRVNHALESRISKKNLIEIVGAVITTTSVTLYTAGLVSPHTLQVGSSIHIVTEIPDLLGTAQVLAVTDTTVEVNLDAFPALPEQSTETTGLIYPRGQLNINAVGTAPNYFRGNVGIGQLLSGGSYPAVDLPDAPTLHVTDYWQTGQQGTLLALQADGGASVGVESYLIKASFQYGVPQFAVRKDGVITHGTLGSPQVTQTVVLKTTGFDLAGTDHGSLITVDNGATDVYVRLLHSAPVGTSVRVYRRGSGLVTVQPFMGALLNGVTTDRVVTEHALVDLVVVHNADGLSAEWALTGQFT